MFTAEKTTIGVSANRPASATRWQSGLAITILTCLIVLQFVMFYNHFRVHIIDYATVYLDQVNTYLFAYRSHFDFLDGGLQGILNDRDTARYLKSMKGPLVPILALLSTFTLGANRFAVAQVNFIFLVVGEIALFRFIQRRAGTAFGFAAIGAFLLTGTHFAQFGGINDLRLDYSAMVVMLLNFVALTGLLEKRDLQSMVFFVTTLVLAALTRVILLPYLIFAEVLALLLLFAKSSWSRKPVFNQSTLVLFLSTVNSICVFGVHAAIYWRQLFGYYGGCKISGEYLMRMKEFGVTDVLDVITYYPISFWTYFSLVITVTAIIAISGLLASTISTGRVSTNSSDHRYIFLLFPCIVLSVMVCASLYSPSPVVMGVLAGPVAIFATMLVKGVVQSPKLNVCIASSLLIVGQLWFCKESIYPTIPPHAEQLAAKASKQCLEGVVATVAASSTKNCRLYWGVTHDEVNPYNFEILWFELRQCALPQSFAQHNLNWYPETSLADIQADIGKADVVVVPVMLCPLLPGYFEYPGVASIRKHHPAILTILKADFVQASCFSIQGWGDVAIFVRNPKQSLASDQ